MKIKRIWCHVVEHKFPQSAQWIEGFIFISVKETLYIS